MCQINQDNINSDLKTLIETVNESSYDPDIIMLAEQMAENAQETLTEYEEQLTENSSLESQLEEAQEELATQETEFTELGWQVETLEEELQTFKTGDLGEEYPLNDLMALVRPHLNTYGFEAKLEAIKNVLEGK